MLTNRLGGKNIIRQVGRSSTAFGVLSEEAWGDALEMWGWCDGAGTGESGESSKENWPVMKQFDFW